MSNTRSSSEPNRILAYSLRHPVIVSFVLYILAWIIKYFDTFVLRLDELLGEAILTKSLGFVLVVVYVWVCGRKLRDIGFHSRDLGKVLLTAFVGFGALYAIAFGTQLLLLRSSGEDARFVLTAVDPRTGMSGGLLFGTWLLVANLVNSAMEDGLFRGVMIRQLMVRFTGWGAIILQAVLFSLWHISWPLRRLLDGQVTLGEAAFEASGLLLATLISGVVYGYFYYKTDNLWGVFVGHTINNGIFNVLFIQTSIGLQAGTEFGPFLGFFLGGYVLLIPIIALVTDRLKTPEVKPWGEFNAEENMSLPLLGLGS
ncbi:MAG: type II CAAX endopeptidase family protein [Ardenticatenaceae bacterium]|nr:type II CAAX endopeptidase family protein [Ardenticatenaceae bacterium]